MIYARQSTAIIVTVGPTLDASGVAVTGGVVGDFKISKNGGEPAALNASATYTHRHTGYGSLSLTASDVGTVGTVEITMDDTVNACPMKEIQVLEEAVYDALFAASANTFTGSAGSTKVTGVVLADTVTTLTNLPAITANWLTATGIANDAITAAKIADGAIDAATFAAGAINAAAIAADAITDAKVASDVTIASVTGAVGSVTGAVGSVTGNVGGNVGGNVVGSVASVTARVTANTDQINGTSIAGTGSRVADSFVTLLNVASPVFTVASLNQTGDSYAIVNSGTIGNANLKTLIDALTTNTASVATDVNELQAALITEATVTVAASPAPSATVFKTDKTATRANKYQHQIFKFTTGTLIGETGVILSSATDGTFTFNDGFTTAPAASDTGTIFSTHAYPLSEIQAGLSTLDAAGVRMAVGLASANLDTQLDALPTNAELATALGTADDAVLAAIAALNNLSAAQVTAAVPTVAQIWTTALTEAYKTAGSTGTAAQLMYEILQNLTEFSIASVTKTVKKLDGTTAKTYTFDSATTPTSITETT